jgi:hypothetical protein
MYPPGIRRFLAGYNGTEPSLIGFWSILRVLAASARSRRSIAAKMQRTLARLLVPHSVRQIELVPMWQRENVRLLPDRAGKPNDYWQKLSSLLKKKNSPRAVGIMD